jgi:hypothetical protein
MSFSITVYDYGNSSRTLQPVFTPDVAPPGNWVLYIIDGVGGTVDPVASEVTEDIDVTVEVTAYANADYTFTNWLLDGVDGGTDNPIEVADDGETSRTLQPVFIYTPIPPASTAGLIVVAYADTALADYSRANVYWATFDNELLPKLLNTTLPTFQELLERLKTRY